MTAKEAIDVEAVLAEFGQPEADRQYAAVSIANHLADRLGLAEDAKVGPSSLAKAELLAAAGSEEVDQLREWYFDPATKQSAKDELLPREQAYSVALAALQVAAAEPSLQDALQEAIAEQRKRPRQNIWAEMPNYLGVAMVLLVAKFGIVKGQIVVTPLDGKSIVETIKQVAKIVS